MVRSYLIFVQNRGQDVLSESFFKDIAIEIMILSSAGVPQFYPFHHTSPEILAIGQCPGS